MRTKKRPGRVTALLLAVLLTVSLCGNLAMAQPAGEPQVNTGADSKPGGETAQEIEKTEDLPENTDETNTQKEGGSGTQDTDLSETGEAGAPAPAEDTLPDQKETEVLKWSWIDEREFLKWSDKDQRWEGSLPGAGSGNPVTAENLKSMLPQKIQMEKDGETVELGLIWDLSRFPKSAEGGEYTLTAALEKGCTLAEGARPLRVYITLGGADTYTVLPTGTVENAPFQEHIVKDTVSPKGTTIDLFDYWTSDNRTDADDVSVPANFQNKGINQNHALLFGKDMGQKKNDRNKFGNWNMWRGWLENNGGNNPTQGIVANTLTDGYPVLKGLKTDEHEYVKGRDGSESLAYLFDPSKASQGKQSFPDVKNLLQVDEEGYYYYDAGENYAVFYEDSNAFAVYDLPGVVARGANSGKVGQFFPFNAANTVFKQDGAKLTALEEMGSRNAAINHYFGMTMSTRFVQRYNGYTDEDQKTEVTYTFSGDDDAWVFIDGVLVADMGGIHNETDLSINFKTGVVDVAGRQTTIRDRFKAAGKESVTSWRVDENTFADDTYHTLDFFYLERGNDESNTSLKFNLVTVPESSVIKVDQSGEPVAGAEFTLFAPDGATKIATGTTDKEGEFVFVNDEGYILSIDEIYGDYYDEGDLTLRETKVPDGYRKSGDIKLYFHQSDGPGKEVLLLSRNHWDTGAYASSKVTTLAPEMVKIYDDSGQYLGEKTPDAGRMFAVVMQKQGNDVWYPVSGDPLKGWKVWGGSDWGNIIAAAKESPYIFEVSSSGDYQVEVDSLPGDVKTYYHITGDEESAKYTVSYYYTEASTIDAATKENTYLMNPRDVESQFERVFSADIYVPNIKNNLYVQKLDENGAPVTDGQATFALYAKDSLAVAENGTYTIDPEAQPSYTVATEAEMTTPITLAGGAAFQGITKGEYYLVETKAPEGYTANPAATRVVVDDTGVYADAGTAGDGIRVERSIGNIVRSMVQFAEDDDVDATLHDIRADLQISADYETGQTQWDKTEQSSHFQYSEEEADLEYGVINDGDPWLGVDEGYSRLDIHQCVEPAHNAVSSPKQDLVNDKELMDPSLTNLFSGLVKVQVRNQSVGSLKLSKTVKAEEGMTLPDPTPEFKFKIKLTTESTGVDGEAVDQPLAGTYPAEKKTSQSVTDKTEVTFDEQGEASVILKHGDSLEIKNLPKGTSYTVTEIDIPVGYQPSVTVNGKDPAEEGGNEPGGSAASGSMVNGTVSHKETADVAFTNTYSNSVTLTGETALKGKKTLAGGEFTEDYSFEFTLTPGDEATKGAVTNKEIVIAENAGQANVTGNGKDNSQAFTFGDVTFKKAGVYIFHIAESKGDKTGVAYDGHTAVVTVEIKPNGEGMLEATVCYSNEGAPSEADREETGEAAFTNYLSAGFSFKKVDETGEKPLAGAVFAVYRQKCNDNHEDDLVELGEDGAATKEKCWELIAKAASGKEGLVKFENLQVGDYRLVEIKAPGGYVVPKGQWKISYSDEERGFIFPEDSAVGNPPAVEKIEGDKGYQIQNYKPGSLPFSGNTGIKIFIIAGIILMTAGTLGTLWWYVKGHGRRLRRK